MSGKRDFFLNLQPCGPYLIGLPNGSTMVAPERGSVFMGPNFTVHNILFIPELKCNFISLGELMKETNCFISISNGLCVIQDPISKVPKSRLEWVSERMSLFCTDH